MEILEGKKVLIIKLRYIGDTLSLYPVLETLYRQAPDCLADVMVNKGTEDVIKYHPGIRRLWLYDRKIAKKSILKSIGYHKRLIKHLRIEKYDFVIDFTHGDRAAFMSFSTGAPQRISYNHSSALSHLFMNRIIKSDPNKHHIVDYQLQALELLGVKRLERRMGITIPENIQSKIDGLLADYGLDGPGIKAVLHPGARGPLRRWKPDRFAKIAQRLKETHHAAVILIGGPDEGDILDEVESHMGFQAAMKSTRMALLEMAALFRRCRIFIGNDSAPGHIAAAVHCPNLTLFGPTFPHMWRPFSPVGEVVFKNPPCCGCRQTECSRPHHTCMDMIEVDEVWEKAGMLLKSL